MRNHPPLVTPKDINMYCAVCGKPLISHALGAYLECCDNLGYWYKSELFIDHLNWPKGLKAKKPEKKKNIRL